MTGNWKTHYVRLCAKRFISGQGSSGEILLDLWALSPIAGWHTNIRTPYIYREFIRTLVYDCRALSLCSPPNAPPGTDPWRPRNGDGVCQLSTKSTQLGLFRIHWDVAGSMFPFYFRLKAFSPSRFPPTFPFFPAFALKNSKSNLGHLLLCVLYRLRMFHRLSKSNSRTFFFQQMT